jgi:hypothetical protein
LNININDSKMDDDDYLIIAIDSTGIKITNRGQWILDKWGPQNNKKRKEYLKIHIAVDVKSKEIRSMQVTAYEHVHDSKALPELVDNNIKSNKIIGKLFADYNDIFRCLVDDDIYFSVY